MLTVVETFSGIGSQAKALKNIGIEHKIECTADWDINAIIAYDLIHNGKQNLKELDNMTKEDILEMLKTYTLSLNGKKPATFETVRKLSMDVLKRVAYAIKRCNNLVSIVDVKGKDLPKQIDLLTYSFPCQDLSLAGNWHGNKGGIDRDAHNRSGMLWEIERILKERVTENLELPKFLLMENVSAILSDKHIKNFNSWTGYLESVGYYNQIYTLDASKFGVPQKRVRTYMISVWVGQNRDKLVAVENFFKEHNLEDDKYVDSLKIRTPKLEKYLKLNYSNKKYREEANACQPNDTPSRREIYRDNLKIYSNGTFAQVVPTVTTKQDRHPNSGVIDYFEYTQSGKSKFRYLTPRECFLLMGFKEKDYERIIRNNFKNRKKDFFTIEKLNRMAGNSIVVNVLEEIFKQVDNVNNLINQEQFEKNYSNNPIEEIKSKLNEALRTKNKGYSVIM